MTSAPTRRAFTAASLSLALHGGLPAPASAQAADALAALEARHGGRLGVVALDTASGRRMVYRPGERFAMCSTHKFLTAAAILAMVDRGRMKLDRNVSYGRADLLDYAPITRKNADRGSMTVEALCIAAIDWSDNTAANLLLGLIGGPPGWTRYARSIGDTFSRLDRIEPDLNSAVPGDPRDTTTPAVMVGNLEAVLLGKALGDASRLRLTGWLLDSKITGTLLRAGLPAGWRVGDKSGSGERGTRNDIGIILPPKAAPILAAVYYTQSSEAPASREAVIAEAGRIIARSFGT
jgi:beta-lactamase class A